VFWYIFKIFYPIRSPIQDDNKEARRRRRDVHTYVEKTDDEADAVRA